MNVKKYVKSIKKINTFSLLAIGFVVGFIVMYLYFQPRLAYQTKLAKDWANTANQSQKEVISYKEQLASASSQIQTLLNKPPQVEYRTQTQYVPYKPCPDMYYNLNGYCEPILPYPQ